MSNMSYCRFQNTAKDLRDCWENIFDELEWEEFKAREQLISYCKMIIDDVWDTEFEEVID